MGPGVDTDPRSSSDCKGACLDEKEEVGPRARMTGSEARLCFPAALELHQVTEILRAVFSSSVRGSVTALRGDGHEDEGS